MCAYMKLADIMKLAEKLQLQHKLQIYLCKWVMVKVLFAFLLLLLLELL